jgi:signal transduction histidine kinase
MYQWGPLEPPEGASPFVELPVSAPLSAWRLQCFIRPQWFQSIAGRSESFAVVTGLIAVGLVLSGLAVYLYRESTRELREAATRVNFVNQVSHELKTPLTNIRLYTDLLEMDLESLGADVASGTRQRLDVISAECQRLSRLIGNVLTFAGQQRQKGRLQPKPSCVDTVIGGVIQQFLPSFELQGVEVAFQGAAPRRVHVDVDKLEQILVNLLSNVEKYASGGGRVEVTTTQDEQTTVLVVADRGPGIAKEQREKVFEPFFRCGDRLEDAVGAGIGLAIAREQARLHGGDVVVLDSEVGTRLQVTLRTPLVS